MLTKKQIENLAGKVNKKIDLPVIGEKAEKFLLVKAIEIIDKALDDHLPPEYIDFINDAVDGFLPGGENDLEQAIDNTVKFLNKQINLPIIGEAAEEKLFHEVVTALFIAMQKEKSFEKVLSD